MTTGPDLNPDGEAAWLRLRQHLEWCDDFALVFLFSDQPAVSRLLRERLAAIYRARVTGLEIPMPKSPAALFQDLLPRLLHPLGYEQALHAPVWLDLTRTPDDDTEAARASWRQARLDFLARLNEQREPLRRALDRPLVLVLPLAEKALIKALVPDLWAVRRLSLETGPWLAATVAEAAARQAPEESRPFPLDPSEQALVDEWRRLRERGSRERGTFLASRRAFDALLKRGRIGEAAEVAAWQAQTTRRRLSKEPDEPEALRDVSISLDNVGGTDQALGDWASARAAFAESLEISRRLLARLGETPEALRDVSISLGNVGDAEDALGNRAAAQAAFTEAVEITRRLAAALPNHVDYRDLPAWFEQRLAEMGAQSSGRTAP